MADCQHMTTLLVARLRDAFDVHGLNVQVTKNVNTIDMYAPHPEVRIIFKDTGAILKLHYMGDTWLIATAEQPEKLPVGTECATLIQVLHGAEVQVSERFIERARLPTPATVS